MSDHKPGEDAEVEQSALLPTSPAKKVPKAARFQVAQVNKKDGDGGEDQDNDQEDGGYAAHSDTVQFTQYAKSLRYYLTRDALPSESNYRNLMSFGRNSYKGQRPTLEELRNDEQRGKNIEKGGGDGEGEGQQKGKVIKFGWIEGVFMRCLLNIWGVMLFLRLTWVIGQCGLVQGLLVITACNVVTVVTTFSMSAVSTNGQIKGGGIYFMISRSLGPEFGGAIGLMFTLANSIAVSMYTIGFAESLLDMFQAYIPSWAGIVDSDFSNRMNDVRIIGCITIVLILVLAFVGMDWVTRVQKALLLLLICSQVDFLVGSFLPKSDEIMSKGFTGWSAESIKENLEPRYTEGQSFFSVFAVFFPAVTGIVAGANLSGDLKDPAMAIPKGTLLSIAVTYVSYIFYGVVVAFNYGTRASGIAEEYSIWTNPNLTLAEKMEFPKWTDCSENATLMRNGTECRYGTLFDQQTMAAISGSGYLIYFGCFAATLSSAIASLVGAPRVLQALAKDKLYPKIEFFAPGFGANNDPVRGYLLVFGIAVGCILVGDLNVVSSLLSNFFVAAYALINFSVFHASFIKSPGWRPAFKFYNPWVSLLGTFLCIAAMFLMDWVTALITYLIVFILYFYIYYRKPDANWGSSAQAQVFVSALKGVQTLTETPDHVKNYRPKVLVLTGNPAFRPPLVDFANLITKKLSLLVCAHVITEPGKKHLSTLRESTQAWLIDHKIKGFYTVTESASFEDGAKSCLTLAGLGKLAPNMLLMGFKSNWNVEPEGLEQYFNILHSAFDHALSVGILRVKSGLDFSAHITAEETLAAEMEEAERRGSIVGGEEINEDEIEEEGEGEYEEEEKKEKGAGDVVGKIQSLEAKRQRTRTISRAVYETQYGNKDKELIASLTQFRNVKRKGTIDVWWLYDDGGLTLLIPYILTTRQMYSDCSLRVFTLGNKKDDLDRETRNMAALLAKFRIDFSDVTVIPDVTKRAKNETRTELNALLDKLPEGSITDEDMEANKEKTNRHLRLAELLRENSSEAEVIVITLPMPRKGAVSAPLYMAWLDVMTKDLPPTLLIRGNQQSVLTFYS